MAKGGNNSEAIRIQRESLKESKRAQARTEAMMKMQAEAMAGMEMPKFEGAAPPPTAGSQDVEAASVEARQKIARRRAGSSTVYAGAAA